MWCTVVGLALVCETNSWKPERGARTPERSKTAHPGEREVAHSEASARELADAAWVRVPPCGCHWGPIGKQMKRGITMGALMIGESWALQQALGMWARVLTVLQ